MTAAVRVMTKGKRELVLASMADLREFFKDGQEPLKITAAQLAKRYKALTQALLCNRKIIKIIKILKNTRNTSSGCVASVGSVARDLNDLTVLSPDLTICRDDLKRRVATLLKS